MQSFAPHGLSSSTRLPPSRHAPHRAIAVLLGTVLLSAGLTSCATPDDTARSHAHCGTLPPPFHPPVACPADSSRFETESLEVHEARGSGLSIKRDTDAGLRVPPQVVVPFVAPAASPGNPNVEAIKP